MTNYPEDTLRAAERWGAYAISLNKSPQEGITEAIAGALKAERERCAKIADASACDEYSDYGKGYDDAASDIAAAIRGEKP